MCKRLFVFFVFFLLFCSSCDRNSDEKSSQNRGRQQKQENTKSAPLPASLSIPDHWRKNPSHLFYRRYSPSEAKAKNILINALNQKGVYGGQFQYLEDGANGSGPQLAKKATPFIQSDGEITLIESELPIQIAAIVDENVWVYQKNENEQVRLGRWRDQVFVPFEDLELENLVLLAVNDNNNLVLRGRVPHSEKIIEKTFLQTPQGEWSELEIKNALVSAINNKRQLVANRTVEGLNRALFWENSKMQPLALPPDVLESEVNDINNHGAAVGTVTFSNGRQQAIIWETGDNRFELLNTLGGDRAQGLSINDDRFVAGWSENADGERRGCLWMGETAREIKYPVAGGDFELVEVRKINNNGEVIARTNNGHTRERGSNSGPGTTEGPREEEEEEDIFLTPPDWPPVNPVPQFPDKADSCCGMVENVIFFPVTKDPLEPPDKQEAMQEPAMGAHQAFLHDGAFFETQEDLYVKSTGFPFRFQRFYRSNIKIKKGGVIGYNWDFNLNKRIVPIVQHEHNGLFVEDTTRDQPQLYYFNGSGRRDHYVEKHSEWRQVLNFNKEFKAYVTTYQSPPGAFHEIQRYVLADPDRHPFASHVNVDNAHNESIFYVLRDPEGTRYVFNCRGQIIYQIDRHENRMEFQYEGQWHPLTQSPMLSKIIDTEKREYIVDTRSTREYETFGTNFLCRYISSTIPVPVITRITDFSGRTVEFEYAMAGLDPVLEEAEQQFGNALYITRYTHEKKDDYYLLTSIKAPNESLSSGPAYLINRYDMNSSQSYELREQKLGSTSYQLSFNQSTVTIIDPNQNRLEYTLKDGPAGSVIETLKKTGASGPDRGPWTTTYKYNSDGQRTEVENPAGNSIVYEYEGKNRQVTLGPVRNWKDRGLTYENNLARGNLKKIIRRSNQARDPYREISTQWRYEKLYNQVEKEIDARNNEIEYIYKYDKGNGYNGNPVEKVLPPLTRVGGHAPLRDLKQYYRYSNNGQLTGFTDTDNSKTTFSYGAFAYLVAINYPDGSHRYKNDELGFVIEETTPSGTRIKYTVDKRGYVTTRIDDFGGFNNRTDYRYDYNGNLLSIRKEVKDNFTSGAPPSPRPGGIQDVVTGFTYDVLNRKRTEIVTAGQKTKHLQWQYDGNGNITSFTQPSPAAAGQSVTTSQRFDGRDLLISLTQAAGTSQARTTRFDYDLNGNLIRSEKAGNRISDYDYDGFDRLIVEGDDNGGGLAMTLDPNGNPLLLEYMGDKGLGNNSGGTLYKAEREYDAMNNLVKTRVHLLTGGSQAAETLWVYNRAILPEKVIHPNGGVEERKYTPAKKLAFLKDPEGNESKYTYDSGGRLTSVVQKDRENSYDRSRKQLRAGTGSYISAFHYDALDRLIKKELPPSESYHLFYNSDGAVRGILDQGNRLSVFTYDSLGNKLADNLPSNRIRYEYNEAGMVKRISSTLSDQRFTYDSLGRRKTVEDRKRNATTRYRYDESTLRMTVVQPNGNTVGTRYNKLGKAEAVEVNYSGHQFFPMISRLRYRYDGLGRLTYAENGPVGAPVKVSLSYDGLGNITKEEQEFRNDRQTVEYDRGNRFSQINVKFPSLAGNIQVQNRLDKLGRVISVEALNETSSYYYSGVNRLSGRLTGDQRFGNYIIYDNARRPVEALTTDAILNKEIWRSYARYDKGRLVDSREIKFDDNAQFIKQSSSFMPHYKGNGRVTHSESRFLAVESRGATPQQAIQKTYRRYNRTGLLSEVIDVSYNDPSGTGAAPTRLRYNRFTHNQGGQVSNARTKVLRENKLRHLRPTGNHAYDESQLFDVALNERGISDNRQYQYDANGNVTDDGRFRYFYDFQSRLVRVEDIWVEARNMRGNIEYYYDGLGRRVFQRNRATPGVVLNIHNRKDIRFLYSGKQVIAEIEYDGGNTQKTLLARYIPGAAVNEILRMDRRKNDDISEPLASYYVHEGISGGMSFLSKANATETTGFTYFRNYQGHDLSHIREERYIEGGTTRMPYLARSKRYDGFSALTYDELSATSVADYRRSPEVDGRLYLIENWDRILQATQKVHPTPTVIKAMEYTVGGVIIVGLAPAAIAAAPGLVIMAKAGLTSTAISYGASQYVGVNYTFEQGMQDFAIGAVTGGASRMLGGMAALASPATKTFANTAAVALETSLETAIDVGVYGDDFTQSLILNTVLNGSSAIPGNSFTEGTLVSTNEGYVAIEKLERGHKVLSRNDQTGKVAYKEITEISRSQADELIQLEYKNRKKTLQLEGTPAHKIWVENRQAWVALSEVEKNDQLILENGERAAVEKVELITLNEALNTYDIEVDDWHTYFAVDSEDSAASYHKDAVWVHNNTSFSRMHKSARASRLKFGRQALDDKLSKGLITQAQHATQLADLGKQLTRKMNGTIGNIGEHAIHNYLKSLSHVVVGMQLHLKVNVGKTAKQQLLNLPTLPKSGVIRRYIDVLSIEQMKKHLVNNEVKTGNAVRTASQIAFDDLLAGGKVGLDQFYFSGRKTRQMLRRFLVNGAYIGKTDRLPRKLSLKYVVDKINAKDNSIGSMAFEMRRPDNFITR
ncbi:MAG: polymorphic toxin-type HINT domain-containing protein [Deltaproteobacteria bacterium]|nr:polymorphic toxin-type HINT domain-containing protein [Deltaproteobacteria bacterium]